MFDLLRGRLLFGRGFRSLLRRVLLRRVPAEEPSLTSGTVKNKSPRNAAIFAGERNLCVGSTERSSNRQVSTKIGISAMRRKHKNDRPNTIRSQRSSWKQRPNGSGEGFRRPGAPAENKGPRNGTNFAGATALCVGSMERPSKRRISTKKTTKTTVRIRCLRNGPTGNSFPKCSETRASWRVCPGIGIPARAG